VSKPSVAEKTYMRTIGERMAEGDIRCCCIPKYIAVERHHPNGPFWETGTGLKAHDWFILPLSCIEPKDRGIITLTKTFHVEYGIQGWRQDL
jgi:hypothetical protein